jgi:hypothetical protein
MGDIRAAMSRWVVPLWWSNSCRVVQVVGGWRSDVGR